MVFGSTFRWDLNCIDIAFLQAFYSLNSHDRAVARSENPGGLVVLGGDNVFPMVEIGLTDLLKTGGLKSPQPPPLTMGLTTLDRCQENVHEM